MQTDKIGWVGTGVMGEPCCGHLMRAGFELAVTSRSRHKSEDLLAGGAQWCASPRELAAHCSIIFTMVGSPEEVRNVYFGNDGLFAGLQADSVVIDMGTTPPSLTAEIAEQATSMACDAVDAPVSGGDVGARNARLSIMAGGERTIVDALAPLFDCMGSVSYMGPVGSGQHTKLCNQITVAGTMIGVCEGLLYAQRAGLDCEAMVDVIRGGAAACWALDNLAPRINAGDLEPGFMVDHFVKDLGIALTEANRLELDLPGTALADLLYRKLQTLGHGERGTQALILALKNINGLD